MSPGQGQTLLLLSLPYGALAQRQNILPGDPHHPPATWPLPRASTWGRERVGLNVSMDGYSRGTPLISSAVAQGRRTLPSGPHPPQRNVSYAGTRGHCNQAAVKGKDKPNKSGCGKMRRAQVHRAAGGWYKAAPPPPRQREGGCGG